MTPVRTMLWVAVFAASFALVESAVVVYLRALYYPAGFTFPLKLMEVSHLGLELGRELATIVMLASVAMVAGERRWERFGYFVLAFGIWDIFYYLWLKLAIGWPESLVDWDVLFLIPVPWIGPVIAPVLISLLMVVIGTSIILALRRSLVFRPGRASWGAGLLGTALILYSFTADTGATLQGRMPEPYAYWQLVLGLALYVLGYRFALRPRNLPAEGKERKG